MLEYRYFYSKLAFLLANYKSREYFSRLIFSRRSAQGIFGLHHARYRLWHYPASFQAATSYDLWHLLCCNLSGCIGHHLVRYTYHRRGYSDHARNVRHVWRSYSRAKSSKRFIKDPNCKNDNWKIDDLDAVVIRQVGHLLSSPDALQEALSSAAQEKRVKVDKAKLRKRCAEIDGQMEKLIELYQVSTIPMQTVTSRANQLSAEKVALQAQLDAPDEVPAAELFLQAIENYRNGFKSGDLPKRRALLAALIERVTIVNQHVEVQWRV